MSSVPDCFKKNFYTWCKGQWGDPIANEYVMIEYGDAAILARMKVDKETCVCCLWAVPEHMSITNDWSCRSVACMEPNTVVRVCFGLNPDGDALFYTDHTGDNVWRQSDTQTRAMEACVLSALNPVERGTRLGLFGNQVCLLKAVLDNDWNGICKVVVARENTITVNSEYVHKDVVYTVALQWQNIEQDPPFQCVFKGCITAYVLDDGHKRKLENLKLFNQKTVHSIDVTRAFYQEFLPVLAGQASSSS